ncbi:hypothetical protein DKM44_02810 [Deinococcus irradiatisoli]|uniref:Lipoprotein n=1 Tax=Deinococcus irradiatisoli TaxID=2202254 RepID=A0A2Z3JG02_9DEIO|nr:hypothetical protein [Deinococcus irradiatisoli]AWN22300.1 hypothetical protein DKM44_02810 [Deinococcus irradiatisoli]
MKNFCLLLCGLFLSACAPAATSTSLVRVTNPLTPGDVYRLEGNDQNGLTFEGRLTLSRAAIQYSAPYYYIDADNGVLLTDSEGIIALAVLEVGEKEVVCVPYRGETHLPYRGRALRAEDKEIGGLLNRFRSSDNNPFGVGACVISKG